MPYQIGQFVRITSSWVDDDGVPTSPSAKTLMVRRPDGTEFEVDDSDIIEDSAGELHADVELTMEYRWDWRWKGSATILGAAQGYTWALRQRVSSPT